MFVFLVLLGAEIKFRGQLCCCFPFSFLAPGKRQTGSAGGRKKRRGHVPVSLKTFKGIFSFDIIPEISLVV